MRVKSLHLSILLHLLLLKWSQSIPRQPATLETRELIRVKRQDGYVYDKPSISFDLPSRPSTQAPTVDRTQEQQMYYAYPAPAGGGSDAVNIGYSSTAAPTAGPGSSAASGYNYGGPQGGVTGTQSSSGSQIAFGTQSSSSSQGGSSTQTGTSSSGYSYNSAVAASSSTGQGRDSGSSGYNYNTPGSTASGPGIEVSTNAPKYLPPKSSDGGVVNTGSVSIENPGAGPAAVPAVQPPADSYLPPLTQTNSQSSGASGSTNTQSVTAPAQAPSASYIPPIASQPSQPSPNASNSPGKSPAGYLPPVSSSGPSQGSVSAPSSTYLPPIF